MYGDNAASMITINGERVVELTGITFTEAKAPEPEQIECRPEPLVGTIEGAITFEIGFLPLGAECKRVEMRGKDQHGNEVMEQVQLPIVHVAHRRSSRQEPRPRFVGGRRKARRLARLLRYYARKDGLIVGNDFGADKDGSNRDEITGAWVRRHWPIFSDL